MIEQLTQIGHSNFDMAGTKNIVSEFLADHVGKKEFDDNRRILNKPSSPTGTKNPFTTGVSFKLWDEDEGKYVNKTKSKDELITQRNQVLSGSPFEGVYGDYYVEDNTYKFNGEPISQYDILVKEKLIQSGDDASKLGGSNLGKVSPEEEKEEFKAHVASVIENRSEKNAVAAFNNDPTFSGYKFTREFEVGAGRVVNISNGTTSKKIFLDNEDAWEKIQTFMNNNKPKPQ
jgi:hypothetical protein